jgi:hypothetical protein
VGVTDAAFTDNRVQDRLAAVEVVEVQRVVAIAEGEMDLLNVR